MLELGCKKYFAFKKHNRSLRIFCPKLSLGAPSFFRGPQLILELSGLSRTPKNMLSRPINLCISEDASSATLTKTQSWSCHTFSEVLRPDCYTELSLTIKFYKFKNDILKVKLINTQNSPLPNSLTTLYSS